MTAAVPTPLRAPQRLIVLGASGDLTRRLLLPGLGSLLAQQGERRIALTGADRRELTPQDWHSRVQDALREGGASSERSAQIAQTSDYRTLDLLDEAQLRDLMATVDGPTVLYFALPPSITRSVCQILARIGLPREVHLAVEKPFGEDEASARELNTLLEDLVEGSSRVFRVDHFLGTAPVLRLLPLRTANPLLRGVWDARQVESIDVVYDESLTLEGRAGYYDRAGALRDMVQSHLLITLALLAMEEPADLGAQAVHDAQLAALRAVRPFTGDPATSSRRARYTAGSIGERTVPDYLAEDGVEAANDTETLAAVTVEVDTPRWRGVPFTLRSGKALARNRFETVVRFRPVGDGPADRLVIDLDTQEIALRLATGGTDWRGTGPLELRGEDQAVHLWPYGQVLQAVFDGDEALGVRGDVAEQMWRICEPVLAAWQQGRTPMDTYPAGSEGPTGWEQETAVHSS